MMNKYSQNDQETKTINTKQTQSNNQLTSSQLSSKKRPKQIQIKSQADQFINDNPLQFLESLFGCGMQKKKENNDSQLLTPIIKDLLGKKGHNESMINTSFEVRKWQDQQNQHHFKQGKSVFLMDSYQQQKNQKQKTQQHSCEKSHFLKQVFSGLDCVQDKIFSVFQGSSQHDQNENNPQHQHKLLQQFQQLQQFQVQTLQNRQQRQTQTENLLQYNYKVTFIHSIRSDHDICQSIVFQNKSDLNAAVQSSHFIDYDQKIFEDLKKKASQKQMKKVKVQKSQQKYSCLKKDVNPNLKVQRKTNIDIDNISIIEHSSNKEHFQDGQNSFITNFQQETTHKAQSPFYMSGRNQQRQRDKEKKTEKERQKEKFKKNRMAATVQVRPNKNFQSIKTLKNNQNSSQSKKLKEKQKKCIKQTKSRIISEDQIKDSPSSSQKNKFQFASLQFLAGMIQKNGAKYTIKINQKQNNINIQVIPSQQNYNLINTSQYKHKRQMSSYVTLNSANVNTAYFNNIQVQNNQNQNQNGFNLNANRTENIASSKSQNQSTKGVGKKNKFQRSEKYVQRKFQSCQSMDIDVEKGQIQKRNKNQSEKQLIVDQKEKQKNISQKFKHSRKRALSMNLLKEGERQQLYETVSGFKNQNLKNIQKKSIFKKKQAIPNSIMPMTTTTTMDKRIMQKLKSLNSKVINKKKSFLQKAIDRKEEDKTNDKKESKINSSKYIKKSSAQKQINKKQCSSKKHEIQKPKLMPMSPISDAYIKITQSFGLQKEKSVILKKETQHQNYIDSTSAQVLSLQRKKFIFSQTQFFEGNFQNGVKSGYGVQKFKNGDLYKGQYKNNQFQGIGIYEWQNGSIYEGQFKDGKISGYGVWKKASNQILKGQKVEKKYSLKSKQLLTSSKKI